MADSVDILNEQIRYYRDRAPEYDDWYERRGRYDRGPDVNAAFRAELSRLEAEVRAAGTRGDILELAAGTGRWTSILSESARTVTALDSSPETLAINRARNAGRPVSFVVFDLFAWRPPRQYDLVFFGFWLSHVPRARFQEFWTCVRSALKPGGRVFFADTLRDGIQGVAAHDHHQNASEGDVTTRYLNDGRSYQVVKVFYEPEELRRELNAFGWRGAVSTTGTSFLFGHGAFTLSGGGSH